MESQLPSLKKKFLKYESYAGKPIEDIFSKEQIAQASILKVEETQTCLFINLGHRNFKKQPLPLMAQLAPVFGAVVTDINGDGKKDIFMGGNFYGLKPQTGRFDASYGVTLMNDGQGHFEYRQPKETGLWIKGEARDVKTILSPKGESMILVGMNNEKFYLFRKKK